MIISNDQLESRKFDFYSLLNFRMYLHNQKIYTASHNFFVNFYSKIIVKKPLKLTSYLVQLMEHPILWIPKILLVCFLSIFFQVKVLDWYKNTPKNANITRYIKKKNILHHLKLGKLKFGIRKIGCSMSWTRY